MTRQEDTTYEIEVGETYRVGQLQDYFSERSIGSIEFKGSNSYYYFENETLLFSLSVDDEVKVVDKFTVNSGYAERYIGIGIKNSTADIYKLEIEK